MVRRREQFLEAKKDTDRARHNHHQRADVIPLVPYGNCKTNPHQHRNDTNDNSNPQNQLVQLFSIQRKSSAKVIQIYKITTSIIYDNTTNLLP